MSGTANLNFPLFATSSGNWANVGWSLFTAEASGLNGVDATGSITWPLFTLTGSGGVDVGDVDWPLFTVEGTGESGSDGTFDKAWKLFSVSATGKKSGQADLSWNLFTLTAVGGENTPSDLSIDWPLFTVDAAGQSVADPITTSDYVVWVVNTETNQHSTYENFLVTSIQYFNGSWYASTPDGIFELIGTDDNGTDIDAKIYWVPSAMGTSKQKKTRDAFVNLRASGDFRYVAIAGESEERIYNQDMTGFPTNMHRKRIENTRNLERQIWQYGIENVDGSHFDLSDVILDIVVGTRKLR